MTEEYINKTKEAVNCLTHIYSEDMADNVETALRCGMSYANATTLDDFIGKVDFTIQTMEEYHKYLK